MFTTIAEITEDYKDMVVARAHGAHADANAEIANYFPADYGADILEAGSWIMVKRPPHAEITVPALSIWFAKGVTVAGEHPDFPRHMAEIITPDGALRLQPAEYTIVADITKWMGLENDGVLMHFLDENAEPDNMQVFYMQARGISRRDALTSLLPEIANGAFAYFTLPSGYAAYFGY